MLPPALALTSALLLVSSLGSAAAISLPPRTPDASAKEARSPEYLALVNWNRRQAERIEGRYSRRRVDKRDASANLTFDFFASPGYSVRANIGTPPQELYLQLDTGNADTWVAANSAVSARLDDPQGQGIRFYSPSTSTTFQNLTRDVDIDYQPNRYREDADLDGFLAADSITIGGVRSANQSFGVVTNVRELETLPATNAGVLGMGLGVGDDTGSVAWWEAARLDWSSASFGIRLQRFAISNATTGSWPSQALQGGGHLDLGIINSSAYTGEITYSNVTSRERWQIPVEGLAINGRQVAIESSNRNPALRTPQAVVDTSSPYIYVPRRVARAVYDIIRGENSAQGSDDLYQFNDGRSAELVLTFGGVNYTMNTREFCKEPRSAGSCFGEIQGADLDGDDDDDDEAPMWILGSGFLSTVYTIFTVEPLTSGGGLAPRIGFATLAGNRLSEVNLDGSTVGGGEPTQAATGAGTSGSQSGGGTTANSTPGSAAIAVIPITRSLGVTVGAIAALIGVALF